MKIIPIGVNVKLPVVNLEKAIQNGLEAGAADIKIDFKVTTQTWNKKPKFATTGAGEYHRDIFTASEIYYYVNHGTRPHIIRPRNAQSLAFQDGYKAKTSPNVIASSGGGAYGRVVYAREVHHPGTVGRKFDRAIAEKWRTLAPTVMRRAILAAL